MKWARYLTLSLLAIGATLLIIFLRFYQLGQIPYGINVDEASYGYDAYSLLQTRADMWGEQSTSLKSFGDYKPAGLSYTIRPLINYFGLTTFTTRLPSAVFGLLTLVATFYFIKHLLGSVSLAFIGSIILALSPWHFGLSRLFYEPNLGLFFISTSLLAQVKYLQKPSNIKYLILASLLTAVGGYYYAVLRYLGVGMLGVSVLIAHFPHYPKILKFGFIAAVCWAVTALPYFGDMFGSRGLVRLQQETALHTFGDALVINENREMCYTSSAHNPVITKYCYLLWNKPGEKLVNTAKTYVQLLSPKYLFLNGYQKDVLPESYGAYLEILIPFYLLGLFYLTANLGKKKEHLFILISYLLANIPVALAGALNIHRNVVGLYLVLIICIYGIYYFNDRINGINSKLAKFIIIALLTLTYLWSQSRYLAKYFFVYTRMQPEIWLADTPDIMKWLGANSHGRGIIFYDFDFAPLLYSFYNQYDPHDFQQQAVWSTLNQYGWTHLNSIGTIVENNSNIWQAICDHQNNSSASKLLVVAGSKSEWGSAVAAQFKNYTGIHVLHEVYDSQTLYNYLKAKDAPNLAEQCSQLIIK